jgi:hypothetical protein
MSRDTVHRCLETSFTFWAGVVVPGGVEVEVSEDLAVWGGDALVKG